EMFLTTKDPAEAPDAPEIVEVEFVDGTPTALNKEQLSPATLIQKLNKIAGAHGVGRVDCVENRFIGMKSRGVYETPGCTVLHLAHRAVESVAMDREVMHLRDGLIPKFSSLIYNGFWFSPEMQVMRALIEEAQKKRHGLARIELFKGHASVVGRKSPNSLYNPDLAGFDSFASYNSKDAEGFIRMTGLRLAMKQAARRALGSP